MKKTLALALLAAALLVTAGCNKNVREARTAPPLLQACGMSF